MKRAERRLRRQFQRQPECRHLSLGGGWGLAINVQFLRDDGSACIYGFGRYPSVGDVLISKSGEPAWWVTEVKRYRDPPDMWHGSAIPVRSGERIPPARALRQFEDGILS